MTASSQGAKRISVLIASRKNSRMLPLPPPNSRILPSLSAPAISRYHFAYRRLRIGFFRHISLRSLSRSTCDFP